jgi:hypothetical protein
MRRSPSALTREKRRGVILLVVISFLTLFAVVGLSFVFYANSIATASRYHRESHSPNVADVDPELLFSYFLGQLLYDTADDGTGVYSGLRGHSLSRNMFGMNYTIARDGSLVVAANDVPFSGTGRLHFASPLPNLHDEVLINYTYFAGDKFLRDPERHGSRLRLRQPGKPDNRKPYVGGFNVPYTYPDLNNLFLAAVKAGPMLLPDGSMAPPGTLLMPSFHRPWLFGPLTEVADASGTTGRNPNWTNKEGKYLTLRPRPNEMGPGFPYPEDEGGDVKNLIGAPGYYDPRTRRIHNNDSLWLDLDFPVMVAPDGRKYKPLFAPLVIDLDNRINVNVHGNLRGFAGDEHASNSGWGPWEVNLAKVLNQNPAEWKALLRGNPAVSGRYGRDTGPHSPLANNLAPPLKYPQLYAPVDYDASDETSIPAGAPSHPLRLPGTGPSAAYSCFPAVPVGYGNNSDLERINHPKLYNPYRPTYPDRSFAVSEMEALLRYADTGSPALTADVFRLCPQNFGDSSDLAAAARRRGLVTTHSVDVDRPGATPWFWPERRTCYNRLLPNTAYPAGGQVHFPPLEEPPAGATDNEFSSDFRAAQALTGLRRIDLNRYLPDYPKPINGQITDRVGFEVAQRARQILAAEIFECLWKTTGAGDPGLVKPPTGGSGLKRERFEALRSLAQLAVNVVDYIDNDDYITPFNWYPKYLSHPRGEWVYGMELPRLVINEVYAQLDNDRHDSGLQHMNESERRANYYNMNVWVELYNPMSKDPGLSDNGDAVLQVRGQPVYQLLLCGDETRLRDRDNVTGTPVNIKSRVAGFGSTPTVVVKPSDGKFHGEVNGNHGFYVVGPQVSYVLDANPNLPATYLSPNMSYRTSALGQRPTIVLRRLACPHLPVNDPALTDYDPTLPLNPWVTVDYVEKVIANDGRIYDTNGRREGVIPIDQRHSWGRKQPFAAHATQFRRQEPKPPRVNQPQHTFYRHNADSSVPGHTSSDVPSNYPPFDWLVHLDRPLISPMEILQVSAFKPHELLQQFMTGNHPGQRFNHRAAWFDEDLQSSPDPTLSHRLYRALEFLETRSQIIGMMDVGTRSRVPIEEPGTQFIYPLAMAGSTSTDGSWVIEPGSTLVIDRGVVVDGEQREEVVRVKEVILAHNPHYFTAEFLRKHDKGFMISPATISERIPGKININTIWDEDVFQALCDPQMANSFSNPEIVSAMFQRLKASRTPGTENGRETPGKDDHPFRSLATGFTPDDDPDNNPLPSAGLQDTWLRTMGTGSDRAPLLAVPNMEHPYQTYELLNKIFNNVTIRSNVFAVWVTVGFFQVTDDTARPVKLGAELGRPEGRFIRHRMFAIVDRSHLKGNPGPQPRFDQRRSPSPRAGGLLVPYFSIID